MTLLKMGCWEAGPCPGCGPGGVNPLEVWVRILPGPSLALLKAITLAPGPASLCTELHYVLPTPLHLCYLIQIKSFSEQLFKEGIITPIFTWNNRTQRGELGYELMSESELEPRSLAVFYQVVGDFKDRGELGSSWPRWKVLQERLRMLADSSFQALPRAGDASRPWHPAPSFQQRAGLPVLGSEPNSWGCFLPVGHVLALSICCPASLDAALAPLPKTELLSWKEGCLLEPISHLCRGGAVVWGPSASGPMSSRGRGRRAGLHPLRPKDLSCTRLFRQGPSFSILKGQYHCSLSFIHLTNTIEHLSCE